MARNVASRVSITRSSCCDLLLDHPRYPAFLTCERARMASAAIIILRRSGPPCGCAAWRISITSSSLTCPKSRRTGRWHRNTRGYTGQTTSSASCSSRSIASWDPTGTATMTSARPFLAGRPDRGLHGGPGGDSVVHEDHRRPSRATFGSTARYRSRRARISASCRSFPAGCSLRPPPPYRRCRC